MGTHRSVDHLVVKSSGTKEKHGDQWRSRYLWPLVSAGGRGRETSTQGRPDCAGDFGVLVSSPSPTSNGELQFSGWSFHGRSCAAHLREAEWLSQVYTS